MKVAIIARCLYGDKLRGWGRYTAELITELSKLDIELYLFSDRTINRNFLNRANHDKLTFVEEKASSYLLWEQVTLARWVKKHKIDILHCPTHFGLPISAACKKILTLHDAFEETIYELKLKNRNPFELAAISLKLRNLFSRMAADHILTVSEFSKKDLVRLYGLNSNDITVTYPGVSLQQEVSGSAMSPGHDKPYFLYVGGVEARKNIEFLIQAFSLCGDLGVDLIIAGGKASQIEKLKNYAKQLDCEQRVKFLEYVPEAQIPALYAKALCFVYPSLYEGFGLQTLEALSCGAPVLVSQGTSMEEVINNPQALFDPLNPNSLKDQLTLVAKDQQIRNTLLQYGKNRLSSFSWKKMAESTLQVYKNTLAK